jgi:hypothetical protein
VRLPQIWAFEWTADRDFALRAAADCTDIRPQRGTGAAGAALAASLAQNRFRHAIPSIIGYACRNPSRTLSGGVQNFRETASPSAKNRLRQKTSSILLNVKK